MTNHEQQAAALFPEWPNDNDFSAKEALDMIAFAAFCLEKQSQQTQEIVWMPFTQSTYDMFNKMAAKNCLCRFDDGSQVRFNDEHPFAEMTYFQVIEP